MRLTALMESRSLGIYEKVSGAWNETAILAPEGGIWDDRFGTCVDIFGVWAVVCAWGDDEAALDAGAAFLYKKAAGSWDLHAKLMPPGLSGGDHFGLAAAMDDEHLFISAAASASYPNNSGVLYHYILNGGTWELTGLIVPGDSHEGQFFGRDMTVYDNTLSVGAYQDNVYGEKSGSAYVFSYNGSQWIQQQKLIPADGNAGDMFGHSVNLYGNNLLIGALYNHEGSYSSGSAYYYHYSNGSWEFAFKMGVNEPESRIDSLSF